MLTALVTGAGRGIGEVHTLVNNAGVLYCEPYDAIPEAHKREILAVNLEAPVALIGALSTPMVDRKGGRIVNVGSVAAFTGHPDLWYGITKAGLLNLTKSWATRLGTASPDYLNGTTVDCNNGSYPR